jgi:hypothetical protein
MAEIGEPRSGDPGFRHQLNVLSRSARVVAAQRCDELAAFGLCVPKT